MNKLIALISLILGIIFMVGAIVYWITPAGGLPAFMPGFIAGSGVVHIKHGIGSFILGLALTAFAWFKSGKK